MDLDGFRSSLSRDAPPAGLSGPLRALWSQANGDWHEAHRIVQSDEGGDAAWVHAHLHRDEGDRANAAYWYRRAGRPVCESSLDEEWAAIAAQLLGPGSSGSG